MAIEVSAAMLTALQAALSSNALSVSYQGRSVSFRTFDELRQQIEWIERRLASATARPAVVYARRVDRG